MRKQLGIEKEIMLHALQISSPLRSRLPMRGLIKRSLIFRAKCRYLTGVPAVAGCSRAGY